MVQKKFLKTYRNSVHTISTHHLDPPFFFKISPFVHFFPIITWCSGKRRGEKFTNRSICWCSGKKKGGGKKLHQSLNFFFIITWCLGKKYFINHWHVIGWWNFTNHSIFFSTITWCSGKKFTNHSIFFPIICWCSEKN